MKTLSVINCSAQPRLFCPKLNFILRMKENMTTLKIQACWCATLCLKTQRAAGPGGKRWPPRPSQRQRLNSRPLSLTAWLTHLYKGLLTLNGNNCLFVYWDQFIFNLCWMLQGFVLLLFCSSLFVTKQRQWFSCCCRHRTWYKSDTFQLAFDLKVWIKKFYKYALVCSVCVCAFFFLYTHNVSLRRFTPTHTITYKFLS